MRTRLKEMELKAKAVNSETPAKKCLSEWGHQQTTDEDSPSKPAKPAPKKQCPYCLRKFPANLLMTIKKHAHVALLHANIVAREEWRDKSLPMKSFAINAKRQRCKATNKDLAKKSKTAQSVSAASVKAALQNTSKISRKRVKAPIPPVLASSSSSSSDDEDIVETYKNIKAKAKAKILEIAEKV